MRSGLVISVWRRSSSVVEQGSGPTTPRAAIEEALERHRKGEESRA
jgi:hypothetical protein